MQIAYWIPLTSNQCEISDYTEYPDMYTKWQAFKVKYTQHSLELNNDHQACRWSFHFPFVPLSSLVCTCFRTAWLSNRTYLPFSPNNKAVYILRSCLFLNIVWTICLCVPLGFFHHRPLDYLSVWPYRIHVLKPIITDYLFRLFVSID